MTHTPTLRSIRIWLGFFIAGLVLSGLTALPIRSELSLLDNLLHSHALQPLAESIGLLAWIERVYAGVLSTDALYPFLAYGTDWLAFAHLIIAVAFIGPFIDPVRNKWMVTFGMIACASVVPFALIAGAMRGIPFGWRLVDCSFGLAGIVPLLICRALLRKIELHIR